MTPGYRRPVLPLRFEDWIRDEAALIHADGCTGVSNVNGWCCLLHDVEYFYGRDAVDAYKCYRRGELDPWAAARVITFEEANAHFRACNFRVSWLGYLDPRAWARWGAMRLKATREAWDAHRAREASTS